MRGADGDHALVRCRIRHTIQRLARLEPQRDGTLARQVDDFLQARTARTARH